MNKYNGIVGKAKTDRMFKLIEDKLYTLLEGIDNFIMTLLLLDIYLCKLRCVYYHTIRSSERNSWT